MPKVEVSNETTKKIRAFKKVIDEILEEELKNESDYVELVLTIGLDKMVQDCLPKEETLLKTMVDIFNKNPEFVSKHMVETLARGALIQKDEEDKIKKKWSSYII